MTTLTDPSFAAPLAELGNRLQGSVLLPSDPQYAGLATGWNLAVPATPIAVLAVATAEDVQQAMLFAAAQGLTVSVRAPGTGPGGPPGRT
jgi:FAD/FMN-containing dehydrogenase